MKRITVGIAVLALAVTGTAAGRSYKERTSLRRELESLRGELWSARSKADSCNLFLALEEREFLGFDAYIDSLHTQVRGFENLDPGGVPGPEYPEYLVLFDRYNDSVGAWQTKADSLRATEASCRALAEFHNALQDSLRRRSSEVGGDV